MKLLTLLTTTLILCLHCVSEAQNTFTATVNFDNEIQSKCQDSGRLYLFLCPNNFGEPYEQQFPNPGGRNHIFAKNYSNIEISQGIDIAFDSTWIGTPGWDFSDVASGNYYIQALWDQDRSESRIEAPGNLYSTKAETSITSAVNIDINISNIIPEREITKHELAKEVKMKSEVLSKWWDKDILLKASILLPYNYDDSKAYPIRYNVAGYGGRYTRLNRLLATETFMTWWNSETAPQIINVFLDGEGPFGDSYQMDSENSGPYGQALIEEFIPYIEKQYRGTQSMDGRFVDGCSTGGWVSLGLQLYYPDSFNGCFSYSPDAIEFENYQLINIYRDENAFVNEFGISRMVMRNTDGEPMLTLKEFMQYENVLGTSNTYLNSGGQFSAHTALYSPKGKNGLPKPLIDPETGKIDHHVATVWEKYDFKKYTETHWETLGPKIEGKVHIWMGDMDHFYLNQATREFDSYLETTTNPQSDADIQFLATQGHCRMYSDEDVLLQIQLRIEELQEKN